MKFLICKTSGGSEKPCKSAVLLNPEQVKYNPFDNHVWEVEINSPEELVALQKEVGLEIVLRPTADWVKEKGYKYDYTLEVYDTWRE